MSKGRMEDIKELWEEDNHYCDPCNYEWLIEQAERVQELEDIIYQDERQAVLEGMYEQNKRYRKALVEIINARNHFYPTEYVFGVEGIAREALEGDK